MATMALPPYQYQPLMGLEETRLLCLQGGQDGDPLQCSLKHVHVDQLKAYSAVSYVWGCPNTPETLIVDGSNFIPITASLSQALRDIRARNPTREQVLWADGVCIDQKNKLERAKQVSIMNTIYRRADRVLTYTGPETGDSLRAVELLRDVDRCANASDGVGTQPSFASLADDERWPALRALLDRPWPSRVWIVQESLLSEMPPVVLCGRHEISWDALVRLTLLSHDGHLPFTIRHTDDGCASSLLWLGDLRTAVWSRDIGVIPSLGHLLRACHGHGSADPRDKVFAVLNLVPTAEQLHIQPDYEISIPELFRQVAAQIVRSDQSLEILNCIADERAFDLPSWVPDWTRRGQAVALDWGRMFWAKQDDTEHYEFSAGGLAGKSAAIHADADAGLLTLTGFIIDRLASVTDVVCAKTKTKDGTWRAWLREAHRLCAASTPYPTGEAPDRILWLTLVAGRTNKRRRASDAFGTEYQKWVDSLGDAETGAGNGASESSLPFFRAMLRGVHFRRLCRTARGYVGLCPSSAKEGDEVCIVRGGHVPYVLRRDKQEHTFIGEAYIHGIMDGEALSFEDLVTENITVR